MKIINETLYIASMVSLFFIGVMIFAEGVGHIIQTDRQLILVGIIVSIFIFTWDKRKSI